MSGNGKYVVFKTEDFERIAADKGTATRNELMRSAVEDAHVIREQDMFAAPVLYSYASNVQSAIEIMEGAGMAAPAYLHRVRDHFFMAAESAHNYEGKKLPDA